MMSEDAPTERLGLQDEAAFEASLATGMSVTGPHDETAILPPTPVEAPEELGTDQPAWTGKTLSHFKLLRLIGEGAMGIVIQALDVHLQRIVALKVLRKRIVGVDENKRVEQFLREARGAAQIEHPNVVRIHEINQHSGWWYIAMEMVDGENLKQMVKAAGPLPPARACPIIADAATALAVAHELGIVHRDVKPTNLMITRGGRCKLTDFGLVRLSDPNDPFDFTDRSVGTPKFVAPELIRRKDPTSAVDVYSLGTTLYYALTGKPPYVGKTILEILNQHLDAPVPDVREHAPDCPESLALLIQRTMAKDPAERPTAADLAASLDAESIAWRTDSSGTLPGSTLLTRGSSMVSMGSGTLPARAAPEPETQRKSRRALLFGVVLIAAALAVLSYLNPSRKPTSPGGQSAAALARRFPQAPDTYGVLPPNALPAAAPLPDEPPAFSWVGKVDTAGLACVASKRGRRYYAVDDPAARLIRLEDFVGYKTPAEAEADGKTPAP
jgi:eukaryotic-like serine/threonine-protein kinase